MQTLLDECFKEILLLFIYRGFVIHLSSIFFLATLSVLNSDAAQDDNFSKIYNTFHLIL